MGEVRDAFLMKFCNNFFKLTLLSRAALDRATVLLSMTKGGKRIDSVWGSGGGQQSVKHLVKEVTASTKLFFLEFTVCLSLSCLG